MIQVQEAAFSIGEESEALAATSTSEGALVTFTGMVRDFCEDKTIRSLFLEHYPGMTEKSLIEIESQARKRWELGDVKIIHRVGLLTAGEPIVFVGVTSAHRKDAFEAAQFIMDILKNKAPFWKKENAPDGSHWVDAKDSDKEALKQWQSASK